MRYIWKRCFAALLAVGMAFALLPAAALAEEAGGATGQTAVEQVQALIDELPDAEEITADNRADVEAQLSAIDEAKLALTDDERSSLDVTRYDATVSAISALDGKNGINSIALLTDGPYDISTDSITIEGDGTYTITGTSDNGNTITVKSGTVTITLDNVTVKNSNSCAFDIKGGDVTLILADETVNTFESGNYYAGIHVAEGASLTIQGNGTLYAVSKEVDEVHPYEGTLGAGIGGNGDNGETDKIETEDNAGSITINGGTIYAKSEGDGAGIGGGWTFENGRKHGQFKSITITGGTVYAESQRNGAGIGSGCWAEKMGTITITGGEIHAKTAAADDQSYDIGAGHCGKDGFQVGGEISITGGVVYTDNRGIRIYDGELTLDNTIIFSSNGDGEVYGDVTLDSDLTIHEDQTLHIPEGSSLTVSEDRTLTVESGATLKNDGVLDNKGTVNGDGTATGSGEVKGNSITMYYVSVTVPTFESVRVGYTQPEAQAITIQNKGANPVTISSVEVNGGDFTVEPAVSASVGVQLPSGGKDESFTIRPKAELPGGNHTATVTVTYDGGRKAEAEVSFMVHYFAEGEGTPGSPYQIRNLEELEAFRDFINNWQNGGGEGMYFELTADIGLEGNEQNQWTPIGNNELFKGTFDGGGHTISGLFIDKRDINQGLFSYIGEGGTVKNLTVDGAVTCYSYGAGIVGVNYGGTVENCHNKCNVNATFGNCGGVVGVNKGTMEDCYNTGEIHGEKAGGITGENDGGTVTNCYNTGEITGEEYVGGITGENYEGTVTNCYNTGNISGESDIGGVIGWNDGGTVANCYNTGEIHGDEAAGGITGENSEGTVTNCYNTGEIHGDEAGGITGENLFGAVTNCYNTGEIHGDDAGGITGENFEGIVTNCYYLKGTAENGIGYDYSYGYGDGEATPKTTDEFASGEVAWLLQNGQETPVWGQTLASDNCPVLTADTAKAVYRVTFQSLGAEYAVMYANPSGLAELPAEPSKSGFTFAGWSTEDGGPADFNAKTPISADVTVYAVWELAFEGSGTQDAPYLIPDKAALEVFREYVNAGNDGAGSYFKVTNDIDLNNDPWTPIGSDTTPFKGAFDGDGHTISGLSIDTNLNYQGLFGKIESGTVKNLGVAGSVDGYYNVGGITGFMSGGTIENCHSDVSVKGITAVGGIVGRSEYGKIISCYNLGSVYGDNEEIGGIVGANYTDNVVINCYNLGTVSGYPLVSTRVGGIMGNGNGSATNCYNMGVVSGGYSNSVMGGIKGTGTGAVTNSYYLDTCGAAGDGTAMTAAQFASGEVAHLLQDGQETPVWGQTLASDTCPVLTSDLAKAVHTVTFQPGGSEDDVMYYVNSSGLAELPAAPEKAGFAFVGWSTEENGPVDFRSGTPVTADVTLYPIYEEIPSADAALRGKVTEGGLPVAGASVTLRQGGKTVHTAETGAGGSYFFEDVEPGIYELVVEAGDKTMTSMVTVGAEAGVEKNLTMPDDNVSSVLEVTGDETPAVVVGGLDDVARDNAETNPGKTVTVTMTVEAVTDGAEDNTPDLQSSIDAIKSASASSGHEYLDLTVEKTVSEAGAGDVITEITETTSIITVVIPFDPSGKSNIVVYRYHSGSVDTLTQDENSDGERIEVGDEAVTVYAKNFSTYAIGYTQEGKTSGASGTPSYSITIPSKTEGGTVGSSLTSARPGSSVTLTARPDEGYHLGSLTVTDGSGRAVELTDNGDGTYTFTQPYGQVAVKAEFVKCGSMEFADVDVKAWYHDYTDYVIGCGLMHGVGGNLFDPNGAVTRAQMVTVLWNMSGDPVVNYYMTYSDVSESAWYAEAIRWATSEGVVDGYGNRKFGPNDPITREQMATMLYRYEKKYGEGGFDGEWEYELGFTDADKVSDWALEAVSWCAMKGVITGKDGNRFDPKGPAKRCEMAAVLTRYSETNVK